MTQELGVFSPKVAKELLATVRELARQIGVTKGAFEPYTPTPIYFRNRSTANTIEPYGCIQIVGTEEIDGTSYLTVDRPFDYSDSVVGPFLLNGPGQCGPGEIGTAQWGPMFRARKDSSTYSVGTRMGPIADSYELSTGCLFAYCGDDDQEPDLIRVVACETPLLAVASGAGIAANSSGTVTAKAPATGNWTAGTVTYTAWNPTGVAISSNALCLIYPVDAKWIALELC